jgi:hypothetical protein
MRAMTQLKDLRDRIRMSNRGDLEDFALAKVKSMRERDCRPIPRPSHQVRGHQDQSSRPRPADDEMKIISNELRLLKVE